MLRIGFVCEGPTDTPILEAVVEAILGPDFVPRYIQPDRSNLGAWTSGGAGPVEKWCKQFGHALAWMLLDIDVLIVQLDGDRCGPLGVADAAQLCATIKGWLAAGATDPRLVVAIPMQASEAWLVAAHLPADPTLEQTPHPEALLVRKKLLRPGKDGVARKDRDTYQQLAAKLRDRLAEVRRVLPELDRFARKLERFVTPASS
jgi:hypothetical protein